ncbi:hypothetical protein DSO57_1025631 [Entomophthora muscae]|uniref:Uncharacterized protein n=1 Tax=Entomophthora muscae TaxID=34485 RepID=A0ACC2UMN3_9FUNG|nr:hypothetical protein DSO57_1025631 [Entomophthora muscae]
MQGFAAFLFPFFFFGQSIPGKNDTTVTLAFALVNSPRVLDQEIAPAPAPLFSFPGVPLLR